MNDVLAPEANLHTPRSSRRALLRTAAWSVPVVTMVSAAPAFAASPPLPLPALSLNPDPVAQWETDQRLIFNVYVKNSHATTTATNLKVTVFFSSDFVKSGNGDVSISFPTSTAGWAVAVVYSGNGSSRTALATFTTATSLAAGATRALQFFATLTVKKPAGNTSTLTVGAQSSTHTQASLAILPTA